MRINPQKFLSTSSNIVKTVSTSLSLTLADTPKYVSNIKEKVIYKKINDLNSWYTRIIGLDEVKMYQDRVVHLQEKLLTAQERRREIGQALALIRKKSNELQDQLHKVRRQDDLQKFLDLMREETEILRQEKEVHDMFVGCDREEREIFTAFTNAIRDSHEKQRAQLEYTKYLGLVLSIVGSFLAFAYSTLRKNDLKEFVENRLEEMTSTQLNLVPIVEKLSQDVRATIKNNEFILQKLNNNNNKYNENEINELKKSQTAIDLGEDYLIQNKQKIVKYAVYTLIGCLTLKFLTNV